MTCPDCAAPVDTSSADCRRCGVNLLTAFEKRAYAPEKFLPRPKHIRGRRPAAWVFIAFASLCAAAAGFFAAASRWERKLPAQAYVDSERGFAVTPPTGWKLEPVAGEGFGSALRLTDEAATIEVAMTRPGASAASQFSASDASLSGGEERTVDGSRASTYSISGGRTLLLSPNRGKRAGALGAAAPEYENLEWQGALAIIPGTDRDFAVKFWSEKTDFEKRAALFERFLESFMRLRRRSS